MTSCALESVSLLQKGGGGKGKGEGGLKEGRNRRKRGKGQHSPSLHPVIDPHTADRAKRKEEKKKSIADGERRREETGEKRRPVSVGIGG